MNSRLSKISTIAMALSALMILGVFVFPLWVITLQAPQYPQGLGIDIHVDRIEGESPHDLQNINTLNHYIGMHQIVPESIQELKYMKYFVVGLALTAALVALSRRRTALLAWVIIAVILSGVGMFDFYQWEHRYGHDLDPSAAIKIPGMSYQPPMFGTRQMLNFQATAWPGMGGWLAMLAVGLAVACVVYEFRFRKHAAAERSCCTVRPARVERVERVAPLLCLALAVGLVSSACAKRPATLSFGTDACDYCSMTISDERHGALFMSTKGRTYKFDAVECMVESMMAGEKFADVEVHSFYVVDYAQPGVTIDAANASYLVSPAVPSPMGANVSAFGVRSNADSVKEAKGGDVLDWTAIRDYLRKRATS